MHIFILVVSIMAGHSLELLTQIDTFWSNPDYSINEVENIDPFEYGTRLREDRGVHGQLVFRETEDGSKWRVILVYQGKVVVLDEGESIREIPYTFPAYTATFSNSGRYIVLQAAEPEYDGRNGARIDIETGEMIVFDLKRPGTTARLWTSLADDGSLMTRHSHYVAIIESDLTNSTVLDGIHEYSRIFQSYDGSTFIIVHWNCVVDGYNRNGERIWTLDLSESSTSGRANNLRTGSMSSDGSMILLAISDGLAFINGRTGELLDCKFTGEYVEDPVFSSSGSKWISGIWGRTGGSYFSTASGYTDQIDSQMQIRTEQYRGDVLEPCIYPLSLSDNGICVAAFVINPVPNSYRLALCTIAGELLWMTDLKAPGESRLSSSGRSWSQISADGTRFSYYDGVIHIMEVEAR
jgi:hypothetical protein